MDEKIILKAIADHLGISPEDIDRDGLLREELGLGPIELNDLLNYLSKKFNITVNPNDVDSLQKIDDLIALVEDNLLE